MPSTALTPRTWTIVGTTDGSIDAYASGTTNLFLDLSGYMAPLAIAFSVPRRNCRKATTGQQYSAQLRLDRRRTALHLEPHLGSAAGLDHDYAGLISGIPTASRRLPIAVQVYRSVQQHCERQSEPRGGSGHADRHHPSLPNGAQGVAYNATLAAAGGTPPYTWSIIPGHCPTACTLTRRAGSSRARRPRRALHRSPCR